MTRHNFLDTMQFLEELEKYLQQDNNFFQQFDWWFFSKIDETLDEVYIPYYQPKTNRIEKFKPDFIFWFKKEKDYAILFVDPKGTEHADGYRKIEGFVKIFEEEKEKNGESQPKTFSHNTLSVQVKLLLKTTDRANVLQEYQNYWFKDIRELENLMKIPS
ncbi:hypothetical protein [Thermospira aquatica]|uniref:Uncharacterized protein n=1 Tax=Thermospira aquatica TaxID=2828656 RepID=A0AAX3BBN9_9SPIR|nr:hypothetical protein [Thermospira aquatica]URA09733.1 hypothetical protein KDW03_09625 [Thermospira aquatica]